MKHFATWLGITVLALQLPLAQATPADFNGDGYSDILWRNSDDGRNILWFMQGTSRTGARLIQTIPAPWTLAGQGDFNADGTTDLLWRNPDDGRNIAWFMAGGARAGYAMLPTVADSSWRVAALRDADSTLKCNG